MTRGDQLRQNGIALLQLFESASLGIVICNRDGQIVMSNRLAQQMFGYPQEELESLDIEDLIPESMRESHAAHRAAFHTSPRHRHMAQGLEFVARRRDGVLFPAEVALAHMKVDGEDLAVAFLYDNSARKVVEQALYESEERLALLLESIKDYAVVQLDSQGMITAWNSGATSVLGYSREEALGRHFSLYYPPDRISQGVPQARLIEAAATGRSETEDWRVHKNGQLVCCDTIIRPVRNPKGELTGFSNVLRDVTKQRRAEEELLQSRKMEAIGQLAGGVAHDFNNLLTVIHGCATLAIDALPADCPVSDDLRQVIKSAERAASLTRQLLAFGRKQVLQPRVLDLADVVSGVQKMLVRLIPENIELEVRHGQRGSVRLDPQQIEQVVMNLVVNARDAMGQRGRILIETGATRLNEADLELHSGVEPGDYVMLSVSDNGKGMDAATKDRVFEPFFTTKPAGEGTGLGLATVFGIVKQSGGDIWVYSEPGQGSTFKVYFPRVSEEQQPVSATAVEAVTPRCGTILVVEDEPHVRSFTVRVLRRNGYIVREAANGEEALETCMRPAEPIDLLITDVVMPRMSGRELADKLTVVYPELRVLFVSGHTEDTVIHSGMLAEGNYFLSKPFTSVDLVKNVEQIRRGSTLS